jgi:hypothetical protein
MPSSLSIGVFKFCMQCLSSCEWKHVAFQSICVVSIATVSAFESRRQRACRRWDRDSNLDRMRSACHSAVTALFQTSPFPLQIYNKAYVLTRRGTFGKRRALLVGWNQAWRVLLWRREV